MRAGAADTAPARQLVIVDHSLSSKAGHYFEYSRSVAEAASRRGWHVRILANRRLWLDDGDSLAVALGADEVRPVFDYGWDAWSDQPPDQPAPGHFGHDVLGELAAVGTRPDDLVLIHTLGWSQLAQLLGSLAATPAWRTAAMPLFSIVLRYDPHDLDTGYIAGLALLFERLAANTAMAGRVRFHTDTDRLTMLCHRMFRVTASTLPIPFDQAAMRRAQQSAELKQQESRPLTLVYLGDAREEKGYALLPDMVRQLWDSHFAAGRLRFLAQSNFNIAGGEAAVPDARRRLRQFPTPEVQLLTSALDTESYYALLAAADIVLLPYDPLRYQSRSSGTLVQAQCAGKVVVTSRGSWMETRPGGTLTFDGPADFVAAVRSAVQDHAALRRQAREAAPAWQAEASPDHFLEVLERAHDVPPPPGPSGPPLLFVMDAEAMVLRNGAASVARSQLRGLFAQGWRVTGLFVQMTRPADMEAVFAFSRALDAALSDLPFDNVHLCSYAPDAGAQASHDFYRRAEQTGEYSIERDLNFRACLQIPAALWRQMRQERPRLVVLNYVTNLPLLDKLGLLEGPDAVPVLCEMHDIQSFQKAIYGQRDLREADLDRELALLARATRVVSLATTEADLLRRRLPDLPVEVLPPPVPERPIGPVDLAGLPGLDALPGLTGARPDDAARRQALAKQLAGWRQVDLLFVSSAHKPNLDGLRWFIDRVFLPLLVPMNMTLTIVGDVADQHPWPDHTNIALFGRVNDLRPLYAAGRIVILPIFGGAGAPIKALEALSLGRAVVGTSYALRHLAEAAGQILPIADTPEDFTRHICRLAADFQARAVAAVAGMAIARSQAQPVGRHGRFAAIAAAITGPATGEQLPPLPAPDTGDEFHEWNEDWGAVSRSIAHLVAGEPASMADLRTGANILAAMGDEQRALLLAGRRPVDAMDMAPRLPIMLRIAAGQALWGRADRVPISVAGGRLPLEPGMSARNCVLLPAAAPFQIRFWYAGRAVDAPDIELTGAVLIEKVAGPDGVVTCHCRSQPAVLATTLVGISLTAREQPVSVEDVQISIRHVPWLRAGDEGRALTFDTRQGWQGIAMGVNDTPYARTLETGTATVGLGQLCGWRPSVEVTLLDLGGRDWRNLSILVGDGGRLPIIQAEPVIGGLKVMFHDPGGSAQTATGVIHLLGGGGERGVAIAALSQTVSILPPAPPDTEPRIAGHIDAVSPEGVVSGWVWDAAALRRRLTVHLLHGDDIMATALACAARPDVRAAGFGDGYYGFSLTIPASARGLACTVKVAETAVTLTGTVIWR